MQNKRLKVMRNHVAQSYVRAQRKLSERVLSLC
jgi:hypothetical protein